MTKTVKTLLILACVQALSACEITPVKAWERGNLANPVMAPQLSEPLGRLEDHTYSSKESTAGGNSIGAGGCGCN